MPSSRLLPPPSFPTRRSSDLSRRPEPEGAVDVEPRPRLGGCVRDRIEVVERPGVDLARLPAHDRRPLAEPKGIDLHPSLVVRRDRSEEHTSELQSRGHLVCRLPACYPHPLSLHDALPICPAAQSPKAPSTWNHAPDSAAASAIASRSSNAPVLTSPACPHTIVGPSPSRRASTCIRPWSSDGTDRKSTRLNSSHVAISYAVFPPATPTLFPYTTLFRSVPPPRARRRRRRGTTPQTRRLRPRSHRGRRTPRC